MDSFAGMRSLAHCPCALTGRLPYAGSGVSMTSCRMSIWTRCVCPGPVLARCPYSFPIAVDPGPAQWCAGQ